MRRWPVTVRLLPTPSVTTTTSLNLPVVRPLSPLRPLDVSRNVTVLRAPAVALAWPDASTVLTERWWRLSQPRVDDSAVSVALIVPFSLLRTPIFRPFERRPRRRRLLP